MITTRPFLRGQHSLEELGCNTKEGALRAEVALYHFWRRSFNNHASTAPWVNQSTFQDASAWPIGSQPELDIYFCDPSRKRFEYLTADELVFCEFDNTIVVGAIVHHIDVDAKRLFSIRGRGPWSVLFGFTIFPGDDNWDMFSRCRIFKAPDKPHPFNSPNSPNSFDVGIWLAELAKADPLITEPSTVE